MQFIEDRNKKLITCLQSMIYSDQIPVSKIEMIKTEARLGSPRELEGREWKLMEEEQLWGGDNEYYWFRCQVVIPENYQGKTVVLELRTGQEGQWDATNPQFLVYVNGHAKQGADVNHREILLTECARAGESFQIALSAFTGVQNFHLQMSLEMKVLHREIEEYYYDIWVPFQVLELLERESDEALVIAEALTASLNMVDFRKEYSDLFDQSLAKASRYFKEEFYGKHCGHSPKTIFTVGHTHIDVAWMWTLAVTKDKAVRSFSTVLELMRQYPEYVFMSSQPLLYQYVKENEPEVYQEIKERIREKRWEPEGGMFIEADCNLASGEALVRQFLLGKQFFKEEFGADNEILWLPDVFGYSAALPQIMKKCGIRYFMTTKISWNETNKMPYDTFLWEGIDGTKILTHFISARDYHASLVVEGKKRPAHFTTYNGYLNPSQVKGTWKRYSQKELNSSALMCYGHGDGGGGTTRDMLENQKRLAKGIPGCPQTKISTASEFFHQLEQEVCDKKELPKWTGELYLEYHRGTYTSMARNKRYNRRAEFLLQNIEFIKSLESCKFKTPYPKQEIKKLWETVLKNQFHDILPGSSVKEVYEDSRREYEAVQKAGKNLEDSGLNRIISQIDAAAGSLVVFNSNSFAGSDYVYTDYPETENPVVVYGHKEYPIQKTYDKRGVFLAEDIPSRGYRTFEIKKGKSSFESGIKTAANWLETKDLRVTWNKSGQLTSIYDKKNQRELVQEGKCANQLVTYEDRPHNYDAWDINGYYKEKAWELNDEAEMEFVENGSARAVLRIRRTYLDSQIEQDLVFYPEGTRIDVVNRIDWNEKNLLLRSYIYADIHADLASYEIQYGNVQRPTHFNTSWDQAKFEVCAHKWIDLSENGYGVSVLNDCKYGYDIHDGIIGLTMLKSACYPNPEADKEKHEFSYSILLHAEGWRENHTISKAYLFNNPLTARRKEENGGILPAEYSFVSVDRDNIIIEVVKTAEAGDEIVLRMYEAYNRTTRACLRFGEHVLKAVECNMLEEEEKDLKTDGCVVFAEFKPYEIKTIKLQF